MMTVRMMIDTPQLGAMWSCVHSSQRNSGLGDQSEEPEVDDVT